MNVRVYIFSKIRHEKYDTKKNYYTSFVPFEAGAMLLMLIFSSPRGSNTALNIGSPRLSLKYMTVVKTIKAIRPTPTHTATTLNAMTLFSSSLLSD